MVVGGPLQGKVIGSYPLTLFSPVGIKNSTQRPINGIKMNSLPKKYFIYIVPYIRYLYPTPQAATLRVISIIDRNMLTFHNAL